MARREEGAGAVAPAPDLDYEAAKVLAPDLDYEAAKVLAAGGDAPARARLAALPGVAPELLYYLADDDDAAVRGAVALNPATPVRAYGRLARDQDPRVRVLLAQRLGRLLPEVQGDALAALRDVAHHALEVLAIDQVARVRAALAGAIADVECAPPGLVARLARDVAREVAEPVLRACLALTDKDLLDILARRPEPWVAAAVMGRPVLSPEVATAAHARQGADLDASRQAAARASLARTSPAPGGPAPGGPARGGLGPRPGTSTLPPPVLDERGRPLGGDATAAGREGAAGEPAEADDRPLEDRLGAAVDAELARRLAQHDDLDPDGVDAVALTARRRLEWARHYAEREAPEARAARLHAQGLLTEDTLGDALSWGDRAFVCAALALLVATDADVVARVLDTQSPKAVTALAWRAGLSMRGARLLQQRGARIEPRRLLNARLGTDYPLSPEEMSWHLDLFDIK